MPTERVAIVVSSQTAGAERGLQSVGQASAQMASTITQSVSVATTAFQGMVLAVVGLEAGINLVAMAVRPLVGFLSESVSAAREFRGENDALNQQIEEGARQFDRFRASFGAVLLQGLEASQAVPEISALFESLTEQVLDADSALGGLVRQGFAAVVTGAEFAVDALILVGRGIQGIIDTAPIAQNALERFFIRTEGTMEQLVRGLPGGEEETLEAMRSTVSARTGAERFLREQGVDTADLRQELILLNDEYRRMRDAADEAFEGEDRNRETRLAQLNAELERHVTQLEAGQAGWDALSAASGTFFDTLQGIGFGDASLDATGEADGGGGGGGDDPLKKEQLVTTFMGMTYEELLAAAQSLGEDIILNFTIGMKGKGGETAGAGGAGAFGPLSDQAEMFAQQGAASISRFASTVIGQFDRIREAGIGMMADMANTIGNAFTSAGVSSLFTKNPLLDVLGIGFLFSVVGGLLQGALSGGGGSRPAAPRPAPLSVVRPEALGAQTNTYQLIAPFVFDNDGTSDGIQAVMEQKVRRGEVRRSLFGE